MRRLSIQDLRKQNEADSIWVMNETIKKPEERANVVFTARASNGEVVTVAVFATWVPTCLTDAVNRDTLLRSNAFLRAIQIGKLSVIDESSALEILKQRGAKEELERVRKMDINAAVGDAAGLGETTPVTIENVEREHASYMPSASVLAYCEMMESGSGIEALNSLRNLGELTEEEFAHVMKHARGLGDKYREVVEYCREKLSGSKPGGK